MNNDTIPVHKLTQTKRLTKWKKEPTVMDLKEDLRIAEPSHDVQVAKVDTWLNLRNIEGKAKPKSKAGRSSVQPKLVRRQNEWRYSALTEPFLSTEKLFKVKPTTWEDREAARQNETVINWQFRTKVNRVSIIDQVVRTFVDEGSVIIRLGWDRETEIEEVESPIWQFFDVQTEEQAMALQQALEMRINNFNEYQNLPEELQEAAEFAIENERPVFAVLAGTEIIKEEKIIRNSPTLDIINYKNLYLDPAAENDVQKAGFAILSFETSKAELLKDGRYKDLDKVNWASNTPLVTPEHHTESDNTVQFKDEVRKRVVAYEYWGWYDIDGNEILQPIVATWVGDTMIRMEKNPFPDQELPLVIIPYMPIKKSVHGEPDAELLAENQAIQGALTRGMIDLMGRSANGQTGFAKGMLDHANRRRYEAGNDYEFNPNMPPNAAIHQHKYPDIPASAMNMMQLQNQEAEALTGVKAFSGGLSGEAYGDVAAGIKGMLDAASKREMAILRRLAQGIKECGRKLIMMNQEFLSEEEVIRVTNEEFVTIRREDLAGEFDLIVDISTAEIDQNQAQDLSFMLQTIGNTMDFSMTQMILGEIARLKRMPDLAKRIETFKPEPDPMDVRAKELSIQKLELENAKLESDIMLNQAKARAEMAKADQADLDFVEQETGTKHARDMAKQGGQAKGNKSLEITKGILNKGPEGPSDENIQQAVIYDKIEEMLTDGNLS